MHRDDYIGDPFNVAYRGFDPNDLANAGKYTLHYKEKSTDNEWRPIGALTVIEAIPVLIMHPDGKLINTSEAIKAGLLKVMEPKIPSKGLTKVLEAA